MFDFELTAFHIPGVHNVLADALSRWHADSSHQEIFLATASDLDRKYTFYGLFPVSSRLIPLYISFIFLDYLFTSNRSLFAFMC